MGGPYLERLAPYEAVQGYQVNRVIDALTNLRGANVPMINSYAICFGYQPVDAVSKARCRFWVTPNVDSVIKVYLSFTLQPFHVGNQTTSSSTTSSGGSAHSHGVSGQTTSGVTSAGGSGHSHSIHTVAGGGANNLQTDGTSIFNNSGAAIDLGTTTADSTHTHSVPSTNVSGATSASESSHTHTIPSLSLGAPNAIYEAGMAQGVHLFIDGVDQTVALGGPWGTGASLDISALDVTTYIQTVGWHEFQLSSTSIGGLTVQAQYQSLINSTL